MFAYHTFLPDLLTEIIFTCFGEKLPNVIRHENVITRKADNNEWRQFWPLADTKDDGR